MGGRRGGRRPKPLRGHLVRGTFRKDRHGSRSAAEEAVRATTKEESIPEAPSYLPGAAKREWQRVAPTLHAKGLLRTVEVELLAAYAQAVGEIEESEKGIAGELRLARRTVRVLGARREALDEADRAALAVAERVVRYGGRMIPGKNGIFVRNPAVVTIAAAAGRARSIAVEFGMTPSSAARIEIHRGDEASGGVEEFRRSNPKSSQT